jgi:hypothetical protein
MGREGPALVTQLHLIKLCVGVSEPKQLAGFQKKRIIKLGRKNASFHRTRHKPSKEADILAGGSIYWVMDGLIRCRQAVLGFDTGVDDGVPFCRILLDPKIVTTQPVARRPFQGWRYLDGKDAPPDLDTDAGPMPTAMLQELRDLGLL